MTAKVKAWSFSRFDTYRTCPLKFKLKFIDKAAQDTSPAMERGKKLHLDIATYIGLATQERPDVKYQHGLMDELRQFDNKVIEQQWGFTSQWKPTGWFGEDTWYRQICDTAVMYDDNSVEAVDWKTGRRYGHNAEQVELQSVGIFARFPVATHVTTRLAYVDSGDTDISEFPRADFEPLRAKWDELVKPMFNDTEFLPRPNETCGRCPFARSKGGQCRFG